MTDPFTLVREARDHARQKAVSYEHCSAHAVMLAAYMDRLEEVRLGFLSESANPLVRSYVRVSWQIFSEYHALMLRIFHSKELSYKQLTVVTNWLICSSQCFSWRKHLAVKYAKRGVTMTATSLEATSYEKAIAFVARARALLNRYNSLVRTDKEEIPASISTALSLVATIEGSFPSLEEIQTRMRIYAMAGRTYVLLHMARDHEIRRELRRPEVKRKRLEYGSCRREAYDCLTKALALAQGEARSPREAHKIERYLSDTAWFWKNVLRDM